MSGKNFGRAGGYLAVGKVVNVKDDPTQSGQVRVKWTVGGASQNKLQDDEVPWSRTLFPASNPSLGQTGGPHTGLQVNSVVYGIPIGDDGQEFLVIGSVPKSGDAEVDQEGKFDSDIPQPAKVKENDGESQPRHGDINGVVTKDKSIWKYGEEEGGPDKKAAKYANVADPIGTWDKPIGGDQ
jgi:hypothetical protein